MDSLGWTRACCFWSWSERRELATGRRCGERVSFSHAQPLMIENEACILTLLAMERRWNARTYQLQGIN